MKRSTAWTTVLKISPSPACFPLITQYPWQPNPIRLRLPGVFHHREPVIVRGHQDLAEVLEKLYQGKWASICLKISVRACPHLLHWHPAPLQIFLHSSPLAYWAVLGWRLFKSSQRTNISQKGHHGWRRFPSFRMTTMSHICLCRKWTRSHVTITALPLYPLTGQSRDSAAFGKEIKHVCGSLAGGVPLSSQANVVVCMLMGRKYTCCQVLSTVWVLHP